MSVMVLPAAAVGSRKTPLGHSIQLVRLVSCVTVGVRAGDSFVIEIVLRFQVILRIVFYVDLFGSKGFGVFQG